MSAKKVQKGKKAPKDVTGKELSKEALKKVSGGLPASGRSGCSDRCGCTTKDNNADRTYGIKEG